MNCLWLQKCKNEKSCVKRVGLSAVRDSSKTKLAEVGEDVTVSGYTVYFWSNEGLPLEPVHVHVSDGMPHADATKIWITQSKRAMIANPHDKRIPSKILNRLVEMIEAQSEDIISAWIERFGEIEYYC